VALYLGTETIGHLPRILVGGVLLFIGFSFLAKWLIASWPRLPRGEYLVIPLILVTIAAVGFIEGLFLGLLMAFIQFVLKYSKTTVIRFALSGEDAKSTVERNLDDERFLSQQGQQLFVLKLRGYLFFGTTKQLSDRIRKRLNDASIAPLKFVVLDFQSVNGIDSSAAYEFHRLRLMSERQGFLIVLTGMTNELQRHLHAGNVIEKRDTIREFVDLDHGLEWCEQQILATRPASLTKDSHTALQLLACKFSRDCDLRDMLPYLVAVNYDKGDVLIRQGDAARDLYFLEEGEVSVYLKSPSGDVIRLRRTGAGTVLGELGFYLQSLRSASVVADEPCRAFRLTAESLTKMECEHPKLAASLHRFMADLLAERLLRTTHTLEGVLN
jgi:SulP family sulfate permease